MASVWYVYGIVPSSADLGRVPAGIDDAPVVPVTTEPRGFVAALASELSMTQYGAEALDERTSDVEWISERALAHDRVLTWASDRAPVIPLPMFSGMFASTASVHAMLREREPQLSAILGRVGTAREYALRVYRVDAELRVALPKLVPALGELARTAAEAPPGQRYLLERKLDAACRDELKATGKRVAGEVAEALREPSREVVISPIPRAAADAPGTMVLNAAFLVPPDALAGFQETLTELVSRYDPRGFRFDFTGPWPPYHFASGDGNDIR